jgi:hypothetical protein
METAEAMHEDLRIPLRLQTAVCDETIPYPLLRTTTTVIIADANAGFPTTRYDWCGMGAILQSYSQHSDVHELNSEKILDFACVGTRLGAIISNPTRGKTFHISGRRETVAEGGCLIYRTRSSCSEMLSKA